MTDRPTPNSRRISSRTISLVQQRELRLHLPRVAAHDQVPQLPHLQRLQPRRPSRYRPGQQRPRPPSRYFASHPCTVVWCSPSATATSSGSAPAWTWSTVRSWSATHGYVLYDADRPSGERVPVAYAPSNTLAVSGSVRSAACTARSRSTLDDR